MILSILKTPAQCECAVHICCGPSHRYSHILVSTFPAARRHHDRSWLLYTETEQLTHNHYELELLGLSVFRPVAPCPCVESPSARTIPSRSGGNCDAYEPNQRLSLRHGCLIIRHCSTVRLLPHARTHSLTMLLQ